jgi:hypothetical protein
MKKKIIYFIVLLASAALQSCTKSNISTVNDPDFDVTTAKLTYKIGDTVAFKFSGNPDFITYYSGETGFKYANINRTSVGNGKPTLQFTSFASTVGTQANSLKIMASTDFTGVYDTLFNSIKKATWIDLTPRVVLSTGADNVSSGVIDISDINPEKKTIYFAFKKHDDNSATLRPYAWTIRTFALNLLSTDDNVNYSIATLANAGWFATDILNSTYKWTVTGTTLSIGGGVLNTPENEDWLITNPLNIYNVPPDVGVAIKGIDARLTGYSYIFKTAGTYTVTFVAANQNVKEKKQVVKQLTLTVTN